MSLRRTLLGLALLTPLAVSCGTDDPDDVLDDDAGFATPDGASLATDASLAPTPDAGMFDAGISPVLDASVDGAVLPSDGGMDSSAPDASAASDASAADTGTADAGSDAQVDTDPPPFPRVYRVALRVHHGDSGLSESQIRSILAEVNEIWWNQAAICFEAEITTSNSVRSDGFDLFFHRSTLGCNTTANGVYCGDHDVHSLDVPSLRAADDAQWDTRQNPARTSAHELGHGLRLDHYNGYADSNDSLMSSGRQGFKLHDAEISTARARAAQKALMDTSPAPCAAPVTN